MQPCKVELAVVTELLYTFYAYINLSYARYYDRKKNSGVVD